LDLPVISLPQREQNMARKLPRSDALCEGGGAVVGRSAGQAVESYIQAENTVAPSDRPTV
jgi:hypothetical protein